MQVELGDALAKKILVGLGEPRAESFVDVRDCAITAGTVHLASGKMSLEKARADQLNTHRFRLIFGSIVVQSLADSQLRRLTLELHSGATLELSAEAQFASLHQFGIENLASRTTTLRADSAMMRDVALGQIGEGGSIEADYCELNGVEIGIGELLIKIPHAVASELRVEWGGAESPRISAAGLRFGDVTVRHGSTLYQFEGCELINVNYDAAEFSVDLLGIRELGALPKTRPRAFLSCLSWRSSRGRRPAKYRPSCTSPLDSGDFLAPPFISSRCHFATDFSTTANWSTGFPRSRTRCSTSPSVKARWSSKRACPSSRRAAMATPS
jgi:hypothetical protein